MKGELIIQSIGEVLTAFPKVFQYTTGKLYIKSPHTADNIPVTNEAAIALANHLLDMNTKVNEIEQQWLARQNFEDQSKNKIRLLKQVVRRLSKLNKLLLIEIT